MLMVSKVVANQGRLKNLKYNVKNITDISKQTTLSLPAKHIFIFHLEYGPINDTMDLMKPALEGILMNCLDNSHAQLINTITF